MEQFKSTMEDFVDSIRNDLNDRRINISQDVLMGLLIQYVQNLVDNSQDQKRYLEGLYQENWTGVDVTNKELLLKRTYEIAALSYMLSEHFK